MYKQRIKNKAIIWKTTIIITDNVIKIQNISFPFQLKFFIFNENIFTLDNIKIVVNSVKLTQKTGLSDNEFIQLPSFNKTAKSHPVIRRAEGGEAKP